MFCSDACQRASGKRRADALLVFAFMEKHTPKSLKQILAQVA